MRAKFYVVQVANLLAQNGEVAHQEVRLNAVHGGSTNQEDNQFNKASPSGEVRLMIDNPDAMNFLKSGKKYYLDFTEAKD